MADVPIVAAPAPTTRVAHLRPLARALAALFPECKHHLPDISRVRIQHIESLLLHVLGHPHAPDALPYPEVADFVGDNGRPHTYLARLFSELLGRHISAEVMAECVVTRPGQPWRVSGGLRKSCDHLCSCATLWLIVLPSVIRVHADLGCKLCPATGTTLSLCGTAGHLNPSTCLWHGLHAPG